MDTKPRFKWPIRDGEERPEEWGLKSSLAMLYEAKLFHLTGSQELSNETTKVYSGIRNLIDLKNGNIHLTRKVEFLSWTDMVERLKQRVISILQSDLVKIGNQRFSIFALFGNAAIFHIYMFMRDLPWGLPFYNLISSRLRSIVEAVDLANLHKEYPNMTLWVLLMGGLGSSGTPNRGWYAKLFAETCITAGLRRGNAIAYSLAEFMWSDLYLSPVTIGFWNDVARAQGGGASYNVKRLADHLSVAAFNASPRVGFDNQLSIRAD
jgi:hypothetical protein